MKNIQIEIGWGGWIIYLEQENEIKSISISIETDIV
jgi:hypothetical protein